MLLSISTYIYILFSNLHKYKVGKNLIFYCYETKFI